MAGLPPQTGMPVSSAEAAAADMGSEEQSALEVSVGGGCRGKGRATLDAGDAQQQQRPAMRPFVALAELSR